MKLAVICTYFNFVGYERPRANLQRFLRQMEREGVSVFGLEMLVPGQQAATKEFANWTRVTLNPANQLLWQKEAALNLVAKRVPAEFTHFAWCDTDIWFQNPRWVEETLDALDTHDVVQMFQFARWEGRNGDIVLARPSSACVKLDHRWSSHTGFAWATSREFWERMGGLYDRVLSGGGDVIFSLTFAGTHIWSQVGRHLGRNRTLFDRWSEKVCGVKVGFTRGAVIHAWHGEIDHRDYAGRRDRVLDIDAVEDIAVASNGLLKWADTVSKETIKTLADYFQARKEDG